MSETQTLDLTEPLRHLAEHGYARLGVALSPEGIEQLRERSDDLMLGRVQIPGLFFQRDSETGRYDDLRFGRGYEGPRLDYRKLEKLELDSRFLSWIENPLFERIARALIPGEVSLYRATLFCKAATGGTELPWHQDGGRFWGLDRDPTLQIWTALDDVPLEAGCVEVVPDSHRAGLVTPNGGQLSDEVVQATAPESRSVSLPAKAGEVILLHNHVWHRSGINRSGHPRRALSACYMSAETRCVRKKHTPRNFFRLFVPRS